LLLLIQKKGEDLFRGCREDTKDDIMDILEKRKALKNKLRNRERVFAGWTSFGHPSISEIIARSGIDFLGIDLEHSTINQEQSQRIIAACQAIGTLCFPRIASHNNEMMKRVLDSGADGIIVPMVSSSDEVQNFIDWLKYPPHGKRNFGVSRAQGYGLDYEEYVESWNASSSLILQIESIEGVNNVDAILQFDEIEGIMIGPYDLSGSLGIPGQLENPLVKEAAMKVVDACEQYGKSCGIHLVEPNQNQVEDAFNSKYTFVVLSSDLFLLWKWSAHTRAYIDALRLSQH
tara:strand:+ start:3856 stop:4722 length:867 start_codon:yes stop_codon:yes gene_type:complete